MIAAKAKDIDALLTSLRELDPGLRDVQKSIDRLLTREVMAEPWIDANVCDWIEACYSHWVPACEIRRLIWLHRERMGCV